jgi:glycosyltransferase involved in cell wall biosynthesis
MKVSGFTFVRNAIRFDYPVVESITSILPLCDEFVVAVGNSDDGTRELVSSIPSGKIRIIDTLWDESKREGGSVLAEETNKAFDAVSRDSDWAFYLQADEVVHEDFLDPVRRKMERWCGDERVEGLLFNYLHFYGSYDFVADSREWYRREVRIIRNNPQIRSWRDAQGFRLDGRKLNVAPVPGWVYHYGWVKPPEFQQAKQKSFHRYWHDDEWIEKKVPSEEKFDYSGIDSLDKFEKTHPAVMQERIRKKNWHFEFDPTKKQWSLPTRILHTVERKTGWRIGEYKNYKIVTRDT